MRRRPCPPAKGCVHPVLEVQASPAKRQVICGQRGVVSKASFTVKVSGMVQKLLSVGGTITFNCEP
ncbi:MAG: hypothetical protein KDE01_17700, partial [Caldilineaceae bacterium]|nr:hypothetical protein [Caldilineaceae bacterium]